MFGDTVKKTLPVSLLFWEGVEIVLTFAQIFVVCPGALMAKRKECVSAARSIRMFLSKGMTQ